MGMLRPKHAGRYADLARLLAKHGRSDLVRDAGLGDALAGLEPTAGAADGEVEVPPEAEELASDLEALGPTYVKLGQLLSTRADLLPPPYLEALARLQDDVEAFSYAEVERIVTEELGASVGDLFRELDWKPMASASLGQVHAGTLRDGRRVAVKVQRPGIRREALDDLELLSGFASVLDDHTDVGRTLGFGDLVEQFRRTLLTELDYRAEAQNLRTMRANLEPYPRLAVPAPIADYCTSRVLTMELVEGRKVTDLGPLGLMELDGAALVDELFRAYLDQILDAGFVHADPHPGNVLVTPDGTLALIDLGMVAHLGGTLQERLVRMLLALGEGRGEDVALLAEEMGRPLRDYDRHQLRRDTAELVARHHGKDLRDQGAGTIVAELLQIWARAHLRPPAELTMVGKALLNLDEVGRTLDPDFNPQEAMRQHAVELVQRRASRSLSGANVMRAALETKEFVEQLPRRANRVLDALAEGELSIKVDAIDEEELLRDVEKLANRVTAGVILAAIIIGAAMTMGVEADVTILGYPGVSIVFFVVAALGGLVLVGTTLVGDRRRRRRQARRA